MPTNCRTLWIWDIDSDPSPIEDVVIYCWNGYKDNESIRSLLQYVEENSNRLRRKYLSLIHEIGESKVRNKRLIDHLLMKNGLSYWWMTLFVEKSFYKSSITDLIRVLALEEIVNKQMPAEICLYSFNKDLSQVIKRLCKRLGIVYKWKRVQNNSTKYFNNKDLYGIIPNRILSIISLVRYLINRWPLKRGEQTKWLDHNKSAFFCSQFFHLDNKSFLTGKFYSNLWNGLPELLQEKGISSNWLHIFIPHQTVPTPNVAMNCIKRFNVSAQSDQVHSFLSTNLSYSMVLRVLKNWIWLNIIGWKLREIKSLLYPIDSKLFLWPLLRRDWEESIQGKTAIHNLLWIELFDKTLKKLPYQKLGIFPCENQAWERAFIHAWYKNGHGRLIGVTHATIRYWDLRYYSDPRTIQSLGNHGIPRAEKTALNGSAAFKAFLSLDYPKDSLVESEALRYNKLCKFIAKPLVNNKKVGLIKVLILGDYTASATKNMLKLLENSISNISISLSCTMKPHPNYIVDAKDYPLLDFNVVMDPLDKILQNYDIAYSSNMTSASVDAYLAGLRSVVMLDGKELNLSPLRGYSNVFFVSKKEHVVEAFQTISIEANKSAVDKDFFYIDPALNRWQKILSYL